MKQKRKLIGLVLSGGGMHGFAQLGALRILEEKGIKPDLIVGSSIGALIGTALAAGKNPREIEDAAMKTNLIKLIRPTFGQGLIKPEKISQFFLSTIKANKFENLKTKLIINATNLTKGEEITFEHGDLLTALNASIAIPGVFKPVRLEKNLLVDGGFYDVAPIHLANHMDVLIIIDVSKLDYKITPKSGVLDIMKQSVVNLQQRIVELNLNAHRKRNEIIRITPDVSKYSLFEYKKERQKEMMKIGEDEAKKVLSDIRAKTILGIK